jgi:hypothetical protein
MSPISSTAISKPTKRAEAPKAGALTSSSFFRSRESSRRKGAGFSAFFDDVLSEIAEITARSRRNFFGTQNFVP